MNEKALRLVNRLGYSLLATSGMFLDLYGRVIDTDLRKTFPISEHLGDLAFGWNAVYMGKILTFALQKTGLIEPTKSKVISLITAGVIFGLVLINETTGFGGGTPDLRDIPAAAIGVLGAASLIELLTDIKKIANTVFVLA